MVERNFAAELDALGDDEPEAIAAPEFGTSETARQVEPIVQSLGLRHSIERATAEAEAVTKSKGHRGLLGDSFGIMEEDERKAWFDEFKADLDADRLRQNRNEQITERGKAFWSRFIGQDAAEALDTTQVFGLAGTASGRDVDEDARKDIAKRQKRVSAMEEGREELATKTALRSGVENFATGLSGIASGVVKGISIGVGYAGHYAGFDIGPDDNITYSVGKWVDAKARQMFPGDVARQEEFSQKLAQGAGSMIAFYGPAITGKLMGASDRVLVGITAASGALAEGSETFEQATESRRQGREVSEGRRLLAYMGGLLLGSTEALPVAEYLRGGKGGILRTINRQGAEEALQEGGQTLGENMLARLLHDPEREIFKDVGENAAIGYILGGFMQGAQLAASKRAREQARRGEGDAPPAASASETRPGRETTIDLDPYAPIADPIEQEGDRPVDEAPLEPLTPTLEPLAPEVSGQQEEEGLAASMVPGDAKGARPEPDALDPEAEATGERSVLAENANVPVAWTASDVYGRADEAAEVLRRVYPGAGEFRVIRSGSAAGDSAYIRTPWGDIRISDHYANQRPDEMLSVWDGGDTLSPAVIVDKIERGRAGARQRRDQEIARLEQALQTATGQRRRQLREELRSLQRQASRAVDDREIAPSMVPKRGTGRLGTGLTELTQQDFKAAAAVDRVSGAAEKTAPAAAPSFEEISALIPKDSSNQPDYPKLAARIQAEYGKMGWNNLTPDEKAALYQAYGGQPVAATEAQAATQEAVDPFAFSVATEFRKNGIEGLLNRLGEITEEQAQQIADAQHITLGEGATPIERLAAGAQERIANRRAAATGADGFVERTSARAPESATETAMAQEVAETTEAAPAQAQPQEPGISDDTRQSFREILAGKAPRREWEQLLGVDPDQMQALIEEAASEGLVRVDRNGVVRRTARAKVGPGTRPAPAAEQAPAAPGRASARPAAAPQQSGVPTLTIPPEVRLRNAIDARERITGKPVNSIVLDYAARIEEARGTDAFDPIMQEIRGDKLFLKADSHDLAALVGVPVPKSAAKKAALETVERRHRDLLGARSSEPVELIMASFAGERATSANLTARDRAKALERARKSPKAIWQETGWYKGPDGLWRFEIDDSNARLLVDISKLEGTEHRREHRGTLGEILDHPALYEAYPSLRNIALEIGIGDYYDGSVSGLGNGYMFVHVGNDATAERVTEIILHEAQHIVQDIEGFTRGGSPSSIVATNEIRLFEIDQEIERNEAAGVGHNMLPFLKQAREAIVRSQDLVRVGFFGDEPGAVEGYKRLFGEIEARNVMARRPMTAEQRREVFPEETQDYKTSEAILAEEAVGASFDPEAMGILQEAWDEIDKAHDGALSAHTSVERIAQEIASNGIESRQREAIRAIQTSSDIIREYSEKLRGVDIARARGYNDEKGYEAARRDLEKEWRAATRFAVSGAARRLKTLLKAGNEEYVFGVLSKADPLLRADIERFPRLANAVDAMNAHDTNVQQVRDIKWLEQNAERLRHAEAVTALLENLAERSFKTMPIKIERFRAVDDILGKSTRTAFQDRPLSSTQDAATLEKMVRERYELGKKLKEKYRSLHSELSDIADRKFREVLSETDPEMAKKFLHIGDNLVHDALWKTPPEKTERTPEYEEAYRRFLKEVPASRITELRAAQLDMQYARNAIQAYFPPSVERRHQSMVEIRRSTAADITALSLARLPQHAARTPWADFSPIETLLPRHALRNHNADLYDKAKAGDHAAAAQLVDEVLDEAAINRLRAAIGDRQPIIVGVVAEEASGRNAIPRTFAEIIGRRLGLPVDNGIVQTVRAHHTGAGAFARLARQPVFAGPVASGQDYIIVDDTVTMGGTLANLRGYIESQGGHVILASTLSGGDRQNLVPTATQLQALRQKHPELEAWWQNEFGFPIDTLTASEVGHLRKAVSLDAIRDQLSEARGPESSPGSRGVLPQEGGGEVAPSRSSVDPNPPSGGFSMSAIAAAAQIEFSDAFLDSTPEIALRLKEEIERMLPPEVAVRVVDRLTSGGMELFGRYDVAQRLVSVSLADGVEKASGTGRHEVIHVLRRLGLFSDAEWKLLADRAKKVIDPKSWLIGEQQAVEVYRQFYRGQGEANGLPGDTLDAFVSEMLDQEYVAKLAETAVTTRASYGRTINALLQRIRQFFEALGNALRGAGFDSVDAIFQRVGEGEVARRETRTPPAIFDAFARAPVPSATASQEGRAALDALSGGRVEAARDPSIPAGIADILRSIRASGQGIGIPLRQRGTLVLPEGDVSALAIRAFHGSPHDFDRFDISKIGTGEGAQAYGHGLYFAESEGVAKGYREALAGTAEPARFATEAEAREAAGPEGSVIEASPSMGGGWRAFDAEGDFIRSGEQPGRLYEVRINAEPEEFLDWDKPISQQSEKVREALSQLGDFANWRGSEHGTPGDLIWHRVSKKTGGSDAASSALREAGIPGIRYLDQGSRQPKILFDGKPISSGTSSAALAAEKLDLHGNPEQAIASLERDVARGGYAASASREALDLLRSGRVARHQPEGTHNYVLFDDALIEIVAKDGKPVSNQQKQDIVAASIRSVPSQPQPRPFTIEGFSGSVTSSEDADGNRVRTYRVSEEEGSPSGFAVIKEQDDGSWSVSMVSIDPNRRRQGIPSRLLRAIEEDLGQRIAPQGWLTAEQYAELAESNPEAVRYHQPAGPAFDDMWVSPKQMEFGAEILKAFAGQAPDARTAGEALAQARQLEAMRALVPAEAFEQERAQQELNNAVLSIRSVPERPATDTPEFRHWFGDSKVVDENGKPLVVYHGTPDARFLRGDDAQFKGRAARFGMEPREDDGAFWFASSRSTAASYADDTRAFDYQNAEPSVEAFYLSLQNPLIIDAAGKEWRNAQARGKTSDVIDQARAEGRDGVIIRNVRDNYDNNARAKPTDTFVVFRPEQIKSIHNRGTFDPDSPLIMASIRGGLPHNIKLGTPQKSGLDAPEKSLSDLVSDLTDALGLTVRQGRLSPGLKAAAGRLGMRVAGQFSRATGVTRIAIPNDLATLAHEGGHALETRNSTRDDVRQLQSTYAEELITPVSRNYPAPQLPASGYSGIELDADTQQVLAQAVQADANMRAQATAAGQAKSSPRFFGRAQTPATTTNAYRDAGILRGVLIRRLGQRVADAVLNDVKNSGSTDLAGYIAQRFSRTGTPAPRPPLPQASRTELSEGWAEFFRRYVTNPREAQIQAPRLYHAFEDMLDGADPEMLEALQDVQKGFTELQATSPTGAVLSRVKSSVKPSMFAQFRKDLAEKGTRATISDKLYTFYHGYLDGRHPMKKAVKFLMDLAADNIGVKLGDNERLVLKAIDDPYKMWRIAAHAKVWATATLQSGVRLKGEADPSGPSFHEALATAFGGAAKNQWNDEKAQLFGSYLIARRMLAEWKRYERGELDNPPDQLIEKSVWRKARADIEKAHPEFAKAADQLYQFNKRHLQNKYLNGFISKDLFLELNAREDYVPLNRMMDDNGPSTLSNAKGQNKRKLIYRFKGSTRDFINPIESIVQDVYATQARFALNDVIRAMDRLARAAGPGGGAVAERIPATDFRGVTVDIREAMQQAARDLDPNDAQGLIEVIDDLFDQNASATIFQAVPTEEKGEPIVYLWEDGKKVPIRLGDNRIARDIFETMVALGRNNAEPFIDFLALGTQAFRFGVTKAPSYIAVNFVRDQLATWVLSRDYIPVWSGLKGLYATNRGGTVGAFAGLAVGTGIGAATGGVGYAAIPITTLLGISLGARTIPNNDADLVKYQMFAGMSGVDSGLVDAMSERDVLALRRKGYLGTPSDTRLKGAWQKVMRASEVTELGSRLGHFKAANDRAIKDGFTPEEAATEATYAALDVMDFWRRGAKMGQIARIAAFMNAAFQGLDAARRTATGERDIYHNYREVLTPFIKAANGSPLSIAEKEAIPNSVRMWVKIAGIGMLGVALAALYRDDEEYAEFNDYMKATHWFFKIGGVWWRVPKPFELGVLSNLFEAAFDRWWRNDERAHLRFAESILETFVPPAEFQGAELLGQIAKVPTAIRETLVGKAPFAKSSDSDIPQHLRALPPELQFTAYTSELGKLLGASLNWSPAQIDSFITNTFATLGRDALSLSDQVLPPVNQLVGGRIPGVSKSPRADKSIEDYVFLSRFARRASRGALSTQHFWQQMSQDGGKYVQAAAGYKELRKAGSDSGAKELLDRLDPERRAYAMLEGHYDEKDQDIHPLNRARQVLSAMSGIRREMILDRLVKQSTANKKHTEPEKITLSPAKQKIVNEILEDLGMREARNALVVVQHPGWRNKSILSTDGLLAELRAAVPEVADELEYRLSKGRNKVYPFEGVRKAWPKVRDTLLKEGPDAILSEFRTEARFP